MFIAGCAQPLAPEVFQTVGPPFEPMRFFEGRVVSTGVVESRNGIPTSRVETETNGRREGNTLVIDQTLVFDDGRRQTRGWRLRQTGPDRYEATISDGLGPATGQTYGNLFRTRWSIALRPGNPLFDVTLDQWMRMSPDGTMVNRTRVTKAGILLATVTEHFRPIGAR